MAIEPDELGPTRREVPFVVVLAPVSVLVGEGQHLRLRREADHRRWPRRRARLGASVDDLAGRHLLAGSSPCAGSVGSVHEHRLASSPP